MKRIKVRRIRDVEMPVKIAKGDWIDLRCGCDVVLKKGDVMSIPLGVAMELPEGYEAIIAPRSSTCLKHGVLPANSPGVIDEPYKGDNDEWGMSVYAFKDTFIPKGARLCQFRILEHQPEIEFVEVDTLGNPDRGGWGSTGVHEFNE